MELSIENTTLALELIADFNPAQIDYIIAQVSENTKVDMESMKSKLDKLTKNWQK